MKFICLFLKNIFDKNYFFDKIMCLKSVAYVKGLNL